MENKICTKCKKEQPASTLYFYRDKKGKQGLTAQCKECRNKQNLNYKTQNYEKHLDYQKKYREENKENAAIYHKEYRKINAEKLREHYLENREDRLERSREWHKKNKEQQRKYFAKYHLLNREANKERRRKYMKTTKAKQLKSLYDKRRRTKRLNLPVDFNVIDWDFCKSYFQQSCAYCGEQENDLQQDHFIPLAKGGGYVRSNMVPACISCNSSKKDNDFMEWYSEKHYFSKNRIEKIYKYFSLFNEKVNNL